MGALLGPLIPNTLAKDYRNARWQFAPYLIRGVGDILLATIRAVPVALFLLFVYGLNTSTGMVVFSSTVQRAVPDAVRGRVFTLLDETRSLMQLLSLALGGLLVEHIGIQAVYWAGGALLFCAGTIIWALRLWGSRRGLVLPIADHVNGRCRRLRARRRHRAGGAGACALR